MDSENPTRQGGDRRRGQPERTPFAWRGDCLLKTPCNRLYTATGGVAENGHRSAALSRPGRPGRAVARLTTRPGAMPCRPTTSGMSFRRRPTKCLRSTVVCRDGDRHPPRLVSREAGSRRQAAPTSQISRLAAAGRGFRSPHRHPEIEWQSPATVVALAASMDAPGKPL